MNYPEVDKPTGPGTWWAWYSHPEASGWVAVLVFGSGAKLRMYRYGHRTHQPLDAESFTKWAGPIPEPDDADMTLLSTEHLKNFAEQVRTVADSPLCLKCFDGPDAYCPGCAAMGRPPLTPEQVLDT
jgi:hypothetical protein